MSYETVARQTIDFVQTITLNRPDKLNALSRQMKDELGSAISEAIRDPGTRAVILTGAGAAFCAGADLKDMRPEKGLAFRQSMQKLQKDLVGQISAAPKPFIAAVNGAAIGAGFSMAAVCDVVLVSPDAYFLAPQLKLGIVPDLGLLSTLPRLIGSARARAAFVLAERIDAATAVEWGLAYREVPAGDLLDLAGSLAARASGVAPAAVVSLKKLLALAGHMSLEQLLEAEASEQTLLRLTSDHEEALQAFKEQRRPVFTGR